MSFTLRNQGLLQFSKIIIMLILIIIMIIIVIIIIIIIITTITIKNKKNAAVCLSSWDPFFNLPKRCLKANKYLETS